MAKDEKKLKDIKDNINHQVAYISEKKLKGETDKVKIAVRVLAVLKTDSRKLKIVLKPTK